MRHLRDPQNVCAAILIVVFLLPWVSSVGDPLAGYELDEFFTWGTLAWLIPVAALGVIASQVFGSSSTALSVTAGLLPLAWTVLMVVLYGESVTEELMIGAWAAVLTGLGLVAAAVGARARERVRVVKTEPSAGDGPPEEARP